MFPSLVELDLPIKEILSNVLDVISLSSGYLKKKKGK